MNILKILGCGIALTILSTSSLCGEPPSAATSTAPITQGLYVYTVGHSFHAWVARLLDEAARSAGIQDHRMGVMGLGASTVLECWDIPHALDNNILNPKERAKQPEKNTAKEVLASRKVDVLTLSPIWMPDAGIDDFAAYGLQYNPNIRVTVQEFWLPNDTYEPVYPLDTRKKPVVDHDAATIPDLQKHYGAYFHDVDEYVRGVNKKLGKDVIFIVPVGQATLALREKIVAGKAPGIEKQSELFVDPWGHPAPPLQILSAYCHFAVVYRRSPVGLPMPSELQGKYRNDALNQLLQELAWDAVIHHPMSGVSVAASENVGPK